MAWQTSGSNIKIEGKLGRATGFDPAAVGATDRDG
jgi:hypothetical protein